MFDGKDCLAAMCTNNISEVIDRKINTSTPEKLQSFENLEFQTVRPTTNGIQSKNLNLGK